MIRKANSEIVNLSAKDQIARLLANENLTVLQGDYETASFDVKTRTLYLPNWDFEKLGKDVGMLLTGHEVGHALWTAPDFMHSLPTRPNMTAVAAIHNVVEDIRIERLIQNRYPGLEQVFTRAYVGLDSQNFFKKELVENFADRLNYQAKTGNSLGEWNAEERALAKEAYTAETQDEVMAIVAKIYDYLKEQEEENQDQQDGDDQQQDQGDSDENQPGSGGSTNPNENQNGNNASDDKAENGEDDSEDKDSKDEQGEGADSDEGEGDSDDSDDSDGDEQDGSSDSKKSESAGDVDSGKSEAQELDGLKIESQQAFDENVEGNTEKPAGGYLLPPSGSSGSEGRFQGPD